MYRGIYPGRFQPFHLGHMNVIKWGLERVDELIVLIGSAQESHTLSNPFTAGERIEMINGTLREQKIPADRVILIPIPDILMNGVWVYHVKMYVPKFNAVIARNPLVNRLFREADFDVLEPPLYNREKYNSTLIRKQIIISDPSWIEAVPEFVVKYVKLIGGDIRLKEIAGTDKPLERK
ncbi:nicotinamide-nucleotide adenylyltransferase [Sulfolobales archaeon HS-7]|nr:nicotinamide-nucleotide adenylyltransferase [Sulfolobales archaeon HS-7]